MSSTTVCPPYHRDLYVYGMHILFVVQTPVLLFISYCVKYKSTPAMNTFKMMLLHQIVWLFINQTVKALLVVPVTVRPIGGISSYGILNLLNVPPHVQYHLDTSVLGGVVASTISLLENRFYCYQPPNSMFKISDKARAVIYVTRLVLFTNLALPLTMFTNDDQNSIKEKFAKILPCFAVELYRNETFFYAENVYALYKYLSIGVVSFGIFETLFYAFGVVWILRKSSEELMISEATKQLQKKFFRAILVQEIAPWLIAYQPQNFIIIFGSITGQGSLNLNNLSTFLMTTHSIWASISLLLIVKPYREFFLGLLLCRRNNVIEIRTNSSVFSRIFGYLAIA
ncbi:unnamed protein product [Caenorhabditis auriculariae]|uniref:Serpentine Receptor, class H n=1 Tax=Caenorhabditis auriculariae TaxID=2777116 RepID=A0A8S1HC92_9PELO|nr:unnamed protein product [Caenorhabditis auriculariae]